MHGAFVGSKLGFVDVDIVGRRRLLWKGRWKRGERNILETSSGCGALFYI